MANQAFDHIPILDLRSWQSNNTTERKRFIDQLNDACHHVGFFYLRHHGIDTTSILKLVKQFFDLNQAEKEKISITNSPHFRGYGKLGAEKTRGLSDHKETLDFGLEQPARDMNSNAPYFILQGPNQWPDSLGYEWRQSLTSYMNDMRKLGMQLMSALSIALNQPESAFNKQHCADDQDAYAMLRLLHYPSSQKPTLGVGPHVDAGCLVLLLQDHVGGLQVQNRNGDWVDAPAIENAFIVNIGEMLQTWSNDYFVATPYHVINSTTQERFSAPFFFEPNLSSKINKTQGYGEHMLNIFQRSFPESKKEPKEETGQ